MPRELGGNQVRSRVYARDGQAFSAGIKSRHCTCPGRKVSCIKSLQVEFMFLCVFCLFLRKRYICICHFYDMVDINTTMQ